MMSMPDLLKRHNIFNSFPASSHDQNSNGCDDAKPDRNTISKHVFLMLMISSYQLQDPNCLM